MTKLYLLLGFLLTQCPLFAQSSLSGWINSAGGTSSNGEESLTFALGGILGQTLECERFQLHREVFATDALPITTWLEDPTALENHLFFPNPILDMVYLRADSFKKGAFYLYNTQGQIVFKRKSIDCSRSINLSHLSSGIYQLTFYPENTQKSYSYKLIKQ